MKVFSLGLLFGVAVFCGVGWSSSQVQCQPSFLVLSAEPIAVAEEGLMIEANGALIGCEERLATITSGDLDKLRGLLADLLRQKHYGLIVLSRDKEVRRVFVEDANSIVGREVATDVLLFNVSISEHIP